MNMLTENQFNLINILLTSGEQRIEEICSSTMVDYHLGCPNSLKKNTNCPALYNDVKLINAMDDVPYIIIVKNGIVKIGTKQDCVDKLTSLRNKAITYLKDYSIIRNKMNKDGNFDIIKDQFIKIFEGDNL